MLGIEESKGSASPVAFSTDSWDTIVSAVKSGDTSVYKVGDTKEIDMGDYGTHTLRIANMSTPNECSTTGFSQSACGFVLEFADIITEHAMNDTKTNAGSWPASSMRTFVNNDIYNSLPSELKNGIIDTTVVSGHGYEDTENFTSTDKLYLLSTAEVWADAVSSSNTIKKELNNIEIFSLPAPMPTPTYFISDDSARNVTRQLDYYKNLGVTTTNYSGAIKESGITDSYWWLRSANYRLDWYTFFVTSVGGHNILLADSVAGISPAFRIG